VRFKIRKGVLKWKLLADNRAERSGSYMRMLVSGVRKGIININRKANDSCYEDDYKNQSGYI
jgi:hypothetical protein